MSDKLWLLSDLLKHLHMHRLYHNTTTVIVTVASLVEISAVVEEGFEAEEGMVAATSSPLFNSLSDPVGFHCNYEPPPPPFDVTRNQQLLHRQGLWAPNPTHD